MRSLPKRMLYPFLTVVIFEMLSACGGGGGGGGGGSTLTVNATDNAYDGTCNAAHCSLREAIIIANSMGGSAIIQFNIGGGGLQVIHLDNNLPAVMAPMIINGTSQPGYTNAPLIVLDGSDAGEEYTDGLLLVGGGTTVQGLVIQNFTGRGIHIDDPGGNLIFGCYIGTDATGATAQPNGYGGIWIQGGDANHIGGTAPTERNVISGNAGDGIKIDSAENTVINNYIGTNAAGTAALGNTGNGVTIANQDNTIGGPINSDGNVISGNLGDGVFVDSQQNAIRGNRIGVDAAGTAAVGNQGNGVVINSSVVNLGGISAGQGNIISGNGGDGVQIHAGGVLVQGNYIGTDIDGSAGLGNGGSGVVAFGMGSIQIGGSEPLARNVISANQIVGIKLEAFSNGVTIFGNYIGTNAAGTAALGNIKAGIAADGTGHQIGASFEGGRNLISGNGGPGIAVISTATDIKIQNNYIGTNAAGTAALGNRNGIEAPMAPAGTGVLIGGDPFGEGNVISGNEEIGVLLVSGVTVQGNKIGTDPAGTGALGNGTDGIKIKGSNNVIGGTGFYNTIAFNGGHGVAVISDFGDAVQNSILTNSIHDNGGLGIALDEDAVIPNDNQDPDSGDNNRQNYPVLTSAVADSIAMESVISGTLNSTPGTVFTIEIYTNAACDPSGNGEGHRLIRSMTVTTNVSGQALINAVFPATYIDPANIVTATATDSSGNTSGFSKCIQVVDAGAATATPAAMTFKPYVNPNAIFYGARCTPDTVQISVEIGNPPEEISYVLLFVRLMDPKTGAKTAWSEGLNMKGSGKNIYYYDLSAYDVPEYNTFEEAVLQYQFVVYNKAQEKMGYSEVFGDIAFSRCSPNKPSGAN